MVSSRNTIVIVDLFFVWSSLSILFLSDRFCRFIFLSDRYFCFFCERDEKKKEKNKKEYHLTQTVIGSVRTYSKKKFVIEDQVTILEVYTSRESRSRSNIQEEYSENWITRKNIHLAEQIQLSQLAIFKHNSKQERTDRRWWYVRCDCCLSFFGHFFRVVSKVVAFSVSQLSLTSTVSLCVGFYQVIWTRC